MPSYKDNNNTWYCKFYYENYKGEKKQKKKSGFKTKREADQWEVDFLSNISFSPEMDFKTLVDIYLKDYKVRVRESTYTNSEYIIYRHILPYFEDIDCIADITPFMIRRWQNTIKSIKQEPDGKP